MASYNLAERLAAVREAIDRAILNGGITSMTLGDSSQSVDLQTLRRMETELEQRIRERRGPARTYVIGECA